jgi:hypothetical protein
MARGPLDENPRSPTRTIGRAVLCGIPRLYLIQAAVSL